MDMELGSVLGSTNAKADNKALSNSQEAKRDDGKLPISLVPTQIIKDVAEVRLFGTRKYGDPDNWKSVEIRRYVDALLRHALEFVRDLHSKDDESGIPHYKHMACNMAFICEMMREGFADENHVRCNSLTGEPLTAEEIMMREG